MTKLLYLRLSTLQFMQYFLWGAWFVTLGSYILEHLGNDGALVGTAFAATAIAASLTPFLTRAVQPDTASTASFSSAHQSGVRTAQALSAVVCGVGALPFHLALGRDLGALPLRCPVSYTHLTLPTSDLV